MIQPLWKTVWKFLKKLGIKPPYDPAIPLLGIYPEETKIERDTCIPLFIAVLFAIARARKLPRCPHSRYIKFFCHFYVSNNRLMEAMESRTDLDLKHLRAI